jgi:mono/diheme cytochrome c family protein
MQLFRELQKEKKWGVSLKPKIKPRTSRRFLVLHLFFLFVLATPYSALGFTAPPSEDVPISFLFQDKTITLKNLKNPFKAAPKVLKKGGTLYTKHCFLCHGDLLDGNGLFGKSFFPPPADFTRLDSILSRPQAYTFWRIMKGGQGLPEKYEPWNSAMPAWEETLSKKEVWRIITYIYDTAGQRHTKSIEQRPPSLKRGQQVYLKKCAYCHGEKGKGDGTAADYSMPQPRNLTKGHIKIRSTSFGKIPTDQDLLNVIDKGLNGTTMPGWKHLPENDRKSLLIFIKSLSKKFKKFKKRGKKHKVVKVGKPPTITTESLKRGKNLFMTQCSGCHGVKGRGDGVATQRIVDFSTSAIWPRNLSQPWTFRRGSTRKNIYKTLRTGLSTTSMPKFSDRVFSDEQIWDIVNFVSTLSTPTKPKAQSLIHAKNVAGEISDNPSSLVWQDAKTNFVPLGGQLQKKPKSYFPTVLNLTVRAVHNKKEVAIYIHWDDPSLDPALKEFTEVEVSPPPPIPENIKGKRPDKPQEPATPEYPDSIAVQFPVSLDKQIPYFLNGDTHYPVNLWKWSTSTNNTVEIHANGLEDWTQQKKSSVHAKGYFNYGRYSVILKRSLKDDGNGIEFKIGKAIPISFNVWDGYQEETGNKKSISSWFTLWLDE